MSLFNTVSSRLSALNKEAKGRCWNGYEPVPGKEPYSDDSCKPVGDKKSKDKKKDGKKKKKAMSYASKAAASKILGHLQGVMQSGSKGKMSLPAGKIGNLFPGQKPISPNFNSSEIEKLLPLILNAQNKGMSAGTLGKLFPGQQPIR